MEIPNGFGDLYRNFVAEFPELREILTITYSRFIPISLNCWQDSAWSFLYLGIDFKSGGELYLNLDHDNLMQPFISVDILRPAKGGELIVDLKKYWGTRFGEIFHRYKRYRIKRDNFQEFLDGVDEYKYIVDGTGFAKKNGRAIASVALDGSILLSSENPDSVRIDKLVKYVHTPTVSDFQTSVRTLKNDDGLPEGLNRMGIYVATCESVQQMFAGRNVQGIRRKVLDPKNRYDVSRA